MNLFQKTKKKNGINTWKKMVLYTIVPTSLDCYIKKIILNLTLDEKYINFKMYMFEVKITTSITFIALYYSFLAKKPCNVRV